MTPRECKWCGLPIPKSKTAGRNAEYCSEPCRKEGARDRRRKTPGVCQQCKRPLKDELHRAIAQETALIERVK